MNYTMPYDSDPDANGPEDACEICGKQVERPSVEENGLRFHLSCWVETTEEETDPGAEAVPEVIDEDETTPVPVESMDAMVFGGGR